MNEEESQRRELLQLKEFAKRVLEQTKVLPFPLVVQAMTDHAVYPIRADAEDDIKLLGILSRSCIAAVAHSRENPITTNHPNDVSVHVEKILQNELWHRGAKTEIPQKEKGRSGGGYPDRIIWLKKDFPSYLEIKVSREENIGAGSARNFFYQPTADSKIRYSARHLLAGFTIREIKEKQWELTRWKITDLWFLQVKLKPEYNADNREIYKSEAVLIEGNGNSITAGKMRDNLPKN